MVSDAMWHALDDIHCVVYHQKNHKNFYSEIGLDHPWQSYFASRSAALGSASAELVTATFFGFSPTLIARYVPTVWDIVTPETILKARSDIAQEALAHLGTEVTAVADSLITALSGLTLAGASLTAAHMTLPISHDPVLKLWHAATVLREYRGDRHWAVLTAAGLNGATANALAIATGRYGPQQQKVSGWRDPEWSQAFVDLEKRGWVDSNRQATEAGIAARNQLEDATSRVTMAGLDDEATARLVSTEAQVLNIASALAA